MPGISKALTDAYKRFRDFHGRGARKGEIREIDSAKVVALEIGELIRLDYHAKGESVHRFHIFKKTDRPVLYVSSDGSQAFILAGGYRFTDKGFEG